MLKFLRSIDWKPTFPYLAIIVIVVGCSLLVPHLGQSVQEIANSAPNQTSSDNFLYSASFWEAFATCVIAVFAFLQIRDSRISSERQLRAYVTVRESSVTKIATGAAPVVTLTIANSGETPAYDLYTFADMQIGPYPLPDGIQLTALPFRVVGDKIHFTDLSVGILGKSHPIFLRLPWDLALTGTQAEGITSGRMALYIFGNIAFRDTFGRCWVVNFRSFCGGDAGAGAIHMERAEERERSKEDHLNSLRIAGKSFDASSTISDLVTTPSK